MTTATYRDYLDFKFALDERSLNPDVREAFLSSLRNRPALSVLDMGTGCGASLWRLLNADFDSDLEVTAIDLDADLLDVAFKRAVVLLGARDFKVSTGRHSIRAAREGRGIAVDFVKADLTDFGRDRPGRFDVVMAHAAMDPLPVELMVKRVAGWLRPRGVFYASLNYDGGTTLFPQYADHATEDLILAVYDAAMERQVAGQFCGGARCGRRVFKAVRETGFDILAYGASDYSLTPFHGRYRDGDSLCLASLLDLIRDEAERSGRVGPEALDVWYRCRQKQIEAGQLGLIAHQLDILAEKPSSRI